MISVDKAKCVSIGYCWGSCSQVFMEDTDGKATVIEGQENASDPCVQDSQANCCPEAIVIT